MAIDSKKLLSLKDFETCPIWRYSEDDDLYHAVQEADQLPESERDVIIYAEFVTRAGHKLRGYVVGISRIFSLGLFCGERMFHVNKNIPDLSGEQVQEFLNCAGLTGLEVNDFFPLEYSTLIQREGFIDFRGRFEMSIPRLE